MARFAPSAMRRRLFDAIGDRGRLVQDTVLFGLEVHIPHESLTAAALMDWVADANFGDGPDRRSEAEWAKIASACREAMLIDGRGARCEVLPRGAGASGGNLQNDDGCHAIVRLSNGAVCRIYPEERALVDGAIAVLKPPISSAAVSDQVLELRYRVDESVEVTFGGGARLVKLPRKGLVFQEALSGERHVRHGQTSGVCHEAANGSVAEVWLHSDRCQAFPAASPRGTSPMSTSACGSGSASARRGSRQRARAFQNTAVVRTVLGSGKTSLSETEFPPEQLMDRHPVPELMRRPMRQNGPAGLPWSRPSSRAPMPREMPALSC